MKSCNPKKDCLIIPFPEKCFDFCIERILRVAGPIEKIKILEMDESLANAIYSAYNSGRISIRSFSDLERILDENQIIQIREIFHNFSQEQLDHFLPRLMR